MRMGSCTVSANANKNGLFRKFLIRGTTIANDVYLRCWESKAATGVESLVKGAHPRHLLRRPIKSGPLKRLVARHAFANNVNGLRRISQ
jgi:hypothetical protein